MIRYNLSKILSLYSKRKCLDWLYYHYTGEPVSASKHINTIRSFRPKDSYLIRPDLLVFDGTYKPYKIVYFLLASKRNYWEYYSQKKTYLDLNYYPEINIKDIKHNPLLEVINNKILFKLEEK